MSYSRTRALLRIELLLGLAATPAAAQVVPGSPTVDWERERNLYTAEVLNAYYATMHAWRDAWQREDANAAAEFYTDKAFLLVPDAELIQGRDSIQSYLAKTLPGLLEVRTGLTDFIASDRLAYALGPFWYEVRDDQGRRQSFTGTFIAVLVREGRNWRIRSQVFKREAD